MSLFTVVANLKKRITSCTKVYTVSTIDPRRAFKWFEFCVASRTVDLLYGFKNTNHVTQNGARAPAK